MRKGSFYKSLKTFKLKCRRSFPHISGVLYFKEWMSRRRISEISFFLLCLAEEWHSVFPRWENSSVSAFIPYRNKLIIHRCEIDQCRCKYVIYWEIVFLIRVKLIGYKSYKTIFFFSPTFKVDKKALNISFHSFEITKKYVWFFITLISIFGLDFDMVY